MPIYKDLSPDLTSHYNYWKTLVEPDDYEPEPISNVWARNSQQLTFDLTRVYIPGWRLVSHTVQNRDMYFEAMMNGVMLYNPYLEPLTMWDIESEERQPGLFQFLLATLPKLYDQDYSTMLRSIAKAYHYSSTQDTKQAIAYGFIWTTKFSFLDEHGDSTYITTLGDHLITHPDHDLKVSEIKPLSYESLALTTAENNYAKHRILLPSILQTADFFDNFSTFELFKH